MCLRNIDDGRDIIGTNQRKPSNEYFALATPPVRFCAPPIRVEAPLNC